MNLLISILLIGFLVVSQYWGLFLAPPDRMMGEVYRILFVHVPAAWMAMLFYCLSFLGSLLYLTRRNGKWDRLAFSAAEIGLVLNGLALALGSLWGKPVWGVWWTWDPRLTTTALLFVMYAGYLILRRLLQDPERRAKLSAAVGLLIFFNVPLVYLSVKWWRSLHQIQSSPETMAPEMVLALRMNAVALLALCLLLLYFRIGLAKRKEILEEREAAPQ
jgi:heme exporter protein C